MRDLDIRLALKAKMSFIHADDMDTLVVEELGLCEGRVRVDLAVVNGQLEGYEIKSDHDTLARLKVQAEAYSRALDRVTLVVGGRHALRAAEMVPRWWGIWYAEDTPDGVVLSEFREACDNPRVDPFAQAQLLWREEALLALEERDLDRGLRSKPRRAIWHRLATCIPPDEVGSVVRSSLKRRPGWRVDASPA